MNYLKFGVKALALLAVTTKTTAAWAASQGLPWESPISQITNSLTGPVAKGVGVTAIVAAGLTFAFSEGGSNLKKIMGIVFGLSVAFGGATFAASFFGYGGGSIIP
jgi:type IV secretion system protein TrbC